MSKILFQPYSQANIKNIIFDLGGVVLDIEYKKTLDAFKKLGVDNLENIFTLSSQVELFNKLDCGLISPSEFRNELRNHIKQDLSDEAIDNAWNALLLDWNKDRLHLLEKLKNHYQVYLLSNTNIIHSNIYNAWLAKIANGKNLKDYFDKVYYSYEVGLRKPNPKIFNLVLQENGLIAEETLFIDDTLEHIESAKKLRLQTYNIKPKEGETITDLFK
ncbi:MAG: HAD family hydrolase [Bacteroidales bacterium]